MENKIKVKLDELQNEEMYCLVAPDGSVQIMTLAPDFAICIGMAELMASKGLCKPVSEMFSKGYSILPVKVTIVQNGSEEDGFKKAKSILNNK